MFHNTTMLSTMLNKRVKIWRSVKSTTRDKLGQYPVVNELYKEVFAGIIPQTGSLLNGRAADTSLSRTTHKIITRYHNDITPDMWITYDNVRYNIIYIQDPYLNHERLEIFCEVLL